MPIGPFLLRRLGSSGLAVLGVSLLVFFFLHLVPGDPVDRLAGGDATPHNVCLNGLVQMSFAFGGIVQVEASLSFLGLGSNLLGDGLRDRFDPRRGV